MIKRGEIWWAALPAPAGAGPGHQRPVLVVQDDEFNRSRIRTIVVVPLTSNLHLARAPGNVALSRRATGLPKPCVANVSQIVSVDRRFLTEKVRRVGAKHLAEVDEGLRLVLRLPG